jgi:hypothetical protein
MEQARKSYCRTRIRSKVKRKFLYGNEYKAIEHEKRSTEGVMLPFLYDQGASDKLNLVKRGNAYPHVVRA